jgi:hypothetical protein
VWLASEPAGPARVVLPARLDRAVGDVYLVVGSEVLAEHDRDLVGELLRVRGGDAEDPDPEVLPSCVAAAFRIDLRADDAVG